MKRWRVIIKAESPLSLSERKPGGQFRESLPYIPGAVIRGVVAEIMLEVAKRDHNCDGVHLADHLKDDLQKRDTCSFYQAFVGPRAIIFENAYPGEMEEPPHVLPATAVSCKDWPGFKKGGAPEEKCKAADEPEHHGVFDTLIDRLCWEELRPSGLVYRPVCPICGGRLDAFGGFYIRRNGRYELVGARQRLLTRVALNRRRGVAEDELLYWPSVLAEGVFIGGLWSDGIAEEVKRVLDGKTIYLGGGSSRGLGRCQVTVLEDSLADDLPDRIEEFNKALKERWELYNRLTPLEKRRPWPGNGFFVLDLQADAILKRDGWLPTTVIDEAMLKDATGVKDDSLKLMRSYAGLGYRGGWQNAWGLPKETEAVATMGSVYVFWTEDLGRWQAALADLEALGIGHRRTEGFGRVRVCDEFHLILREGAK
jgi:CRISPR-associated protein Csx10